MAVSNLIDGATRHLAQLGPGDPGSAYAQVEPKHWGKGDAPHERNEVTFVVPDQGVLAC
jgi:hypothetical protein